MAGKISSWFIIHLQHTPNMTLIFFLNYIKTIKLLKGTEHSRLALHQLTWLDPILIYSVNTLISSVLFPCHWCTLTHNHTHTRWSMCSVNSPEGTGLPSCAADWCGSGKDVHRWSSQFRIKLSCPIMTRLSECLLEGVELNVFLCIS